MLNYVIIGVVVVLVILLCFGLAIASFAGENYFDMLRKTQTMRNSYGIATMDFVAQIIQNHFGGRLKLARCAPNDDHYGSGIVALSSETMSSNSLASLATVAHELGHAFHNKQIENERPLNQDYPMPVAETASTFNEVFLGNYAIRNASAEEKLALLENNIRESNQCIVDIYSRYLFETAVFEQCQQKFLMADDLKAIMLDAQKKAYGDGLDPEYMHPYMWVCKTHYYSSGISFYNFPYSFGNLFAEGLYAIYLKEGDSFVDKYKNMLKATPTASIEDIGKQMGIDLTDKKFWQDSLALMAEQIDEFCSL